MRTNLYPALPVALCGITMAAVMMISGCRNDARDASRPGNDSTTHAGEQASPAARPERPQSKQGKIVIEGNEEPMMLELFDSSPYSFPLPFTTYIPADIIAEQVPDSAGPGISFVANFGGTRNADAAMQLFSIPSAASESDAVAVARRAAAGQGRSGRPIDMQLYPWSLGEYGYKATSASGAPITGSVILGRHGDRFFYLRMEYPIEYAEGFSPRARIIFDEWQWSDASAGGIAADVVPTPVGEIDPETDSDTITATVKRIEPAPSGAGANGPLGTLVLEDRNNRDTASNRTTVNVASTTQIAFEMNGRRRIATWEALESGALVRVIFNGAVPAIYPMRVTASEVVILPKEK